MVAPLRSWTTRADWRDWVAGFAMMVSFSVCPKRFGPLADLPFGAVETSRRKAGVSRLGRPDRAGPVRGQAGH
ncbi:hypothetical protein [Sinorhizobium medicae]|nr:hypothetical protein U8C40_38515 [Sinorhizobium medicae]